MASRRLAYSFNQSLRSRAALRSILPPRHRGFATPVGTQVKTESTTLNNGLTVRPFIVILDAHADMFIRLLPNIRHGPRHQQSVSGLTLAAEQRRTGPTVPPIF